MGLKRKLPEAGGTSTPSSSSSSSSSSDPLLSSIAIQQNVSERQDSMTSESIEEQQINPQIAYMKRSHLASRALFDIARREVDDIDVRKHDFAASDISFSSVLQLIRPSGPEDEARSMKQTMLITSAEALVTISKVAELFLMDLALKSWQAKDLSPVQLSVVHAVDAHSISQGNVIRAVRSHEELDFLAEIVHKDPTDTFMATMHRSTFVPKPISGLAPNFFIPTAANSSGSGSNNNSMSSSSSSGSSIGGTFPDARPYVSAAAIPLQHAQARLGLSPRPQLPQSTANASSATAAAFPVIKVRKQYNTKRRQAEAAALAEANAAIKAARLEARRLASENSFAYRSGDRTN